MIYLLFLQNNSGKFSKRTMIGRKHFEIVQWLLIGQPIIVFENSKSQIIEGRESLELEDVLSMEASLMHLGLIQKLFLETNSNILSPKCHRNQNFVINITQKRFLNQFKHSHVIQNKLNILIRLVSKLNGPSSLSDWLKSLSNQVQFLKLF